MQRKKEPESGVSLPGLNLSSAVEELHGLGQVTQFPSASVMFWFL